jgi:hypothetical protein
MPQDTQPLNITINLKEVTTALPLIVDGTAAHVRVKNISQVDRDGAVIVKWELVLTEPAPTVDGAQANAGFPLFINFDTSQEWMLQKMAKFIDGFLGTGDRGNKKGKPERPDLDARVAADLIGKESLAKIVIQKSKKTDYVGNDISSLTYPADL